MPGPRDRRALRDAAAARPSGAARPAAGFTLIEVAIVVTIVGLVAAAGAQFATTYMEQKRRDATLARLDTIEQALTLYVAQNRRLPCPADGTDGTTSADAGTEQRAAGGECNATINGAAGQDTGIVPWKTLGLSVETVIDGWNSFFLYRAADVDTGALCPAEPGGKSTAPTADDGMDLSACDPSVTNEVSDRIAGLGLPVATDPTPAADEYLANPTASPSTGAAYVLISHGPNAFGAIIPSGSVLPTTGASAAELANVNNQDVLPSGGLDAYVETHDDILRFVTIPQLAIKAKIGPRRQ